MKRQHNDTISSNNSEFTKTKLRKTTNMTSYPSPTYSFEESSDYYRVPIGRPTTPVDKIINSLETMPISPIKNNKGELTFNSNNLDNFYGSLQSKTENKSKTKSNPKSRWNPTSCS